MIRLVIADDHELFRIGLAELLKKYEDIEVVGDVCDGQQFFTFMEEGPSFDIVLLDISMPNLDGLEGLKVLNKLKVSVRAIIISMYNEGNHIAKCAKSGAYAYLLKNTDEEELLRAIRMVAKGKKYFGPGISEKMINFMVTQQVSQNRLSNKELEILILIAEGMTTKEIASKLFVSTRTIETHRANILKKLEVKNTAALIKKATETNLL